MSLLNSVICWVVVLSLHIHTTRRQLESISLILQKATLYFFNDAIFTNSAPVISVQWCDSKHTLWSYGWYDWNSSDTRLVLCLTTGGGILSILAAGVPGLGKNWLINKLGNLYSSTSCIVPSKSFSVSLGNPQIRSVAIVTPGTLLNKKTQICGLWYMWIMLPDKNLRLRVDGKYNFSVI